MVVHTRRIVCILRQNAKILISKIEKKSPLKALYVELPGKTPYQVPIQNTAIFITVEN